MFNTIAVGIILLDGWGMIGIWTDKFGFHNAWEVWVYQSHSGTWAAISNWIYVGLPSVLRPFHLPLVQLLANHDLGSHTTRP